MKDKKVYRYKVRASIREDCENFAELNEWLKQVFERSEMVPLGDNEYGSDDWAESSSICSFLWKQDYFFDKAKELLWYNADEGDSDDPESEDFYNVEDCIEIVTEYRKKHGKIQRIS